MRHWACVKMDSLVAFVVAHKGRLRVGLSAEGVSWDTRVRLGGPDP